MKEELVQIVLKTTIIIITILISMAFPQTAMWFYITFYEVICTNISQPQIITSPQNIAKNLQVSWQLKTFCSKKMKFWENRPLKFV